MENLKSFEVGKEYKTSSICDSECIFTYQVMARTNKTITLKTKFNEIMKRKIKIHDNEEFVLPEGYFSMCPVLTA